MAATRAREAAEAALVRAEVQAARAEQRAEQQAARHEERLTELHSVIAELGRQLERHRATVIAEEDESGKRKQTDSTNLLFSEIHCFLFPGRFMDRDDLISFFNPLYTGRSK